MSDGLCRWGLMSAANISRKNWKGIRIAGNGTVRAVASRNRADAEKFIDECQDEVPFSPRPDAVEGYDALLERDDIDAVYIPLPTGVRKSWVIRAAKAGKHVLCEKPCAINAADLNEMISACDAAGVQFMDGVMFVHSERMQLLRKTLDDPANIGRLRRITSQFTFAGDEEFKRSNIRVNSELEPHGCLGDLGWYAIRITLLVMKYQMPTSVRARTLSSLKGVDSKGSVPSEFAAELDFAGGITASFYCSFLTENSQLLTVSGDKGYLAMDDFVLPFLGAELGLELHQHDVVMDNCRWNVGRHTRRLAVKEYAGGEPGAQEVTMLKRFSDIVLRREPEPHWPETALQTQLVLDACLKSAGQDGKPVAVEQS